MAKKIDAVISGVVLVVAPAAMMAFAADVKVPRWVFVVCVFWCSVKLLFGVRGL